ncbi:MAG: hypothetical protein LBC78_01875 [Oscillospiraceae bacterium]|jgi:hypothetical protein|nr:hypothetical protein [Oscillospiraceae bacterium]
MKDDISSAVDDFLSTDKGKKLAARRPELERLARGEDGRRLFAMLDMETMKKAAQGGDIRTLSALISSALKTEEGARIAQQIKDMTK